MPGSHCKSKMISIIERLYKILTNKISSKGRNIQRLTSINIKKNLICYVQRDFCIQIVLRYFADISYHSSTELWDGIASSC